MKENKRFISDCNCCVQCNLTEEEQNKTYLDKGRKPDHECILHNKRLFHRNQENGHLYPCKECGGWDYVHKDIANVITPYIKQRLEHALKKECELQIALNNADKLSECKEALNALTGEIPNMNDLWSNSRYCE
jgi:hypothetical protein